MINISYFLRSFEQVFPADLNGRPPFGTAPKSVQLLLSYIFNSAFGAKASYIVEHMRWVVLYRIVTGFHIRFLFCVFYFIWLQTLFGHRFLCICDTRPYLGWGYLTHLWYVFIYYFDLTWHLKRVLSVRIHFLLVAFPLKENESALSNEICTAVPIHQSRQ